MPTPLFPKLLERALNQHGLLTPEDARALGISEAALRNLAHRGTLERRAFAIYQIPQLAGDPLAQYQEALLWVREPAALTHETAMDLHDLCDINPAKIHVTVEASYRLRRTLPPWLTLHFGNLDEGDMTWFDGLRIATPVRAIVDCIRTHVGQQFIDQAVETGRVRGLLGTTGLKRIEIAQLRQRLERLEGGH